MKFFVYCTSFMKKGRYHLHYLGGQELLGTGFVDGYAKYILGHVDGILPTEGKRVEGEVYDVDQDAVAKMDSMMQDGTICHKEMVEVSLSDGSTVEASTYIWNGRVG